MNSKLLLIVLFIAPAIKSQYLTDFLLNPVVTSQAGYVNYGLDKKLWNAYQSVIASQQQAASAKPIANSDEEQTQPFAELAKLADPTLLTAFNQIAVKPAIETVLPVVQSFSELLKAATDSLTKSDNNGQVNNIQPAMNVTIKPGVKPALNLTTSALNDQLHQLIARLQTYRPLLPQPSTTHMPLASPISTAQYANARFAKQVNENIGLFNVNVLDFMNAINSKLHRSGPVFIFVP